MGSRPGLLMVKSMERLSTIHVHHALNDFKLLHSRRALVLFLKDSHDPHNGSESKQHTEHSEVVDPVILQLVLI